MARSKATQPHDEGLVTPEGPIASEGPAIASVAPEGPPAEDSAIEDAAATSMPGARSRWGEAWSSLSTGETLILAGVSVILLLGDVILAAILGAFQEGFLGLPTWVELAAAELLLVIALRAIRPATTWPASYGLILSALAVPIVVTEILDLVRRLRTLDGFLLLPVQSQLLTLTLWTGTFLVAAGVIFYWMDGGD